MFRTLAFLAFALLLTGCVGSAYKLPEVSATDVKNVEQEVVKNSKPLKTYNRSDIYYKNTLAGITKKLSKNAKPLCMQSGYDRCYFDVKYDSSATVNAYASEGYKITIYKGLLQYLQTNDEIAAVVAHEMGHHLAKHNEETLNNAKTGAVVSGVITTVLLAAANANNPYTTPYQQQQQRETLENMMAMGAHLGAASYSKEQEREADLLATYLLARANYDLQKAENVMVVLAKFSGESDPNRKAFLDSHPAGMERVVAWQKATQEIKINRSKLPYLKETSSSKNGSTQ